MIVVDTSAIISIVKGEPGWSDLLAFMRTPGHDLVMSSATMVETFIAAERRLEGRGGGQAAQELCRKLLIRALPVGVREMAWAIEGFQRFGKGRGEFPAALNFGDCFSYGLAKSLNAPLLFKGADFFQTDVQIAEASRP